MANRGFDFSLGEVSAQKNPTLAGSQSFFPYKIIGMYYRDGCLHIRPSTKLLSQLVLPEGSRIDQAYVDELRKWLFVPSIAPDNVVSMTIITDLIFAPGNIVMVGSNSKVATTGVLGPLKGPRVTFFSARKSKLNTTRNPVTGDNAILVSGSDKLYYLDSDAITSMVPKTFMIFANNKNKPFLQPIVACTEQQRLYIIGVGADLAGDGDANLSDPNALYASVTNDTYDNFSIATSPTVPDTHVAFKFEFALSPTEKLYGIKEFMQKLIITSSETIYSLTSASGQISGVDGKLDKIGGDAVGCMVSDPVQYNGFLVYASRQGIRQQCVAAAVQNNQLYQIYDTYCAMMNPIIFDSVQNDPVHNNIMGLIADQGVAKTLFWTPAQTGGASTALGMTTYYQSRRFACVQVARTPGNIYDLLILQDRKNPNVFYVADETNEYSGRDLIQDWVPKAVVSGWDTATNIVTIASFQEIARADNMRGIWLEVVTDNWAYCIRNNDTDLTFQWIGDLPITGRTGTFNMIPDTTDVSKQIPDKYYRLLSPEEDENLRLDVTWSCTDSGAQIQFGSEISSIIGVPLPMPVDKQSFLTTGTQFIKMEFSFWSAYPKIEWWGTSSYAGAPRTSQAFVMQLNYSMATNFDARQKKASLAPSSGYLHSENDYVSYKFTPDFDAANNVTSIYFVNKKATTVKSNDLANLPKILRIFPAL